MSKKFHINPAGDVRPCVAKTRCQFGYSDKEHYPTEDEAYAALEKRMDSLNKGVLSGLGLKKGFSEKDRRRWTETNSLAKRLSRNFSAEELEQAFETRTESRGIGVSFTEQEFGDRVIGLAYGGDFKAEEEYGSADLAKFLAQGKDQSSWVQKFERDGVTGYVFGYPEGTYATRGTSVEHAWTAALERHQRVPSHLFEEAEGELSLEEKRAELKSAGVRLTKEESKSWVEVTKKWRQNRASQGGLPLTSPIGEFQSGRALVIMTEDKAQKAVLEELMVAAKNNSLRIGSSSNPFSRGILFYDDRDLTVASKNAQVAQKQWREKALERVEPLKKRFRDGGVHVYAISRPTSMLNEKTGEEETKYWLNTSTVSIPGKKAQQLYGWFTEKQLGQLASGDYTALDKA